MFPLIVFVIFASLG